VRIVIVIVKLADNNTTGYKGVQKTPNGTYRAILVVHKRSHYLGTFKTAEEANEARLGGEKKYWGDNR